MLFQGSAKTPGTGQQEAHWAGALISAFESDEPETGAMTVVVVRLIDDRRALLTHIQCNKAS